MGTPKIKFYQLPQGYSEDGDNDVQQTTNDELLPVVDKPLLPEDWYDMTGVNFIEGESLTPINLSAGQITSALGPDSAEFQTPATGHADILVDPSGGFAAIVLDSESEVISSSTYTLSASGVTFINASGIYPSGASLQYWRRGSLPTTTFVTDHAPVYNGNNSSFFVTVYDNSSDVIDQNDYIVVYPSGLVTFDSAKSYSPTIDYTYEVTSTKYFIGQRDNWVYGHLYMSPDIFKGMYDYPGDDSEDVQGNPIVQGEIPQFVDNSEYQIDFRKGLVTFSDVVDTSSDSVHASFAYVVAIRNTTGQTLDFTGSDGDGYHYKAVNDKKFPKSVGSRWVGRNDSYMPRNIYVDGALKPQTVTVTPYDTLTVKTGP
jgi:hypothetical protein